MDKLKVGGLQRVVENVSLSVNGQVNHCMEKTGRCAVILPGGQTMDGLMLLVGLHWR